jgi:excinuclease ABC subunit A
MKAADYIIDLGPGAAEAGGQVVAEGTPEEVAAVKQSATGLFLATALQRLLVAQNDKQETSRT